MQYLRRDYSTLGAEALLFMYGAYIPSGSQEDYIKHEELLRGMY